MSLQSLLGKKLSALTGSLLLSGVLGIIVVRVALGSQAVQMATVPPAGSDLPFREVSEEAVSPAISSIDSSSATCFRPVAGAGACYIQWDYLYVTAASGSYVLSMTVAIDNRLRAYHSGFFQDYIYIPASMTPQGYKVTCGVPGSGGKVGWGKSYNYVIRARDSAGLSAANYGSVTCPADVTHVYFPFLRKKS